MTTDEIRAELEDLRIAGNSPRSTLWDQRRILKQRAALFALLDELETYYQPRADDPPTLTTR